VDGESFNDNEIIMFFNRIGHGEDRQIVNFLIERGKQAGRDEEAFEKGKQAGRDKRYRFADERIKQLNEKIAALEEGLKIQKDFERRKDEKIAALEAENKQLIEAKYVAITDEDTRLMLESLREENARLRDAKTLIGQTIIEYHGTEEWCKKNRSITDQKEGCRWCNLAKKALEEAGK
jgi:hypothetical protein